MALGVDRVALAARAVVPAGGEGRAGKEVLVEAPEDREDLRGKRGRKEISDKASVSVLPYV